MDSLAPTTESGIIIVLAFSNIFQLVLQVSQMFFDSRRDSKDLLIKDLQARMTTMEIELKDERSQRRILEDKVFGLTEKNAYLKGISDSQSKKEELVTRETKTKESSISV